MRHPWPLLVVAVLLVACGGGDDPAAPEEEGPAADLALLDPQGDTLDASETTIRAIDVRGLEGRLQGDTLLLTVRFQAPVTPVHDLRETGVIGIVDFDVDGDGSTGYVAVADDFGASSGLGVEHALVLEDTTMADGSRRVALVDIAAESYRWIPARFEGTAVTVRLPLRLLGITDGQPLRMVGVVGNVERATDVFPNDGNASVMTAQR